MGVLSCQLTAFFVGFACQSYVIDKVAKYIEQQCLRAIHQGIGRIWMEIREHHVGTRDDTLRGCVKHVEQTIGGAVT